MPLHLDYEQAWNKPESLHPPNRRLQLTPLRGRKIVRILEAEFVPIAIPIYEAAQLKRRALDGNPL